MNARATIGALVAVTIGLVANLVTVRHGLPLGHDSYFHLYRLVVWDDLVAQGVFWPRWVPLLHGGYGSPLFHYYPPLLYALAEPWLIVGATPAAALRITLGWVLVAAALGMYRWVRDLFGAGAATVAVAAFCFSPYFMYTLVGRAGFPEIVALAAMPWSAWALCRHATGKGVGYGAVVAVALAAMLLSHLFSAYLCLASLLAYAGMLVVEARTSAAAVSRTAAVLRVVWPIALGAGLAAAAWAPAMWDTDLVQIERMLQIADPATGKGLLPLPHVFVAPFWHDSELPTAFVQPRLHGVALALALIGMATAWTALRSATLRRHVLVASVITVAAVFMFMPGSQWLWQAIPWLRLAQFPYRFLAVAVVWQALLTAAGAAALIAALPVRYAPAARRRRRRPDVSLPASPAAGAAVVVGLCTLLMLYAVTWPRIITHPTGEPTDLAAVQRFERQPEAFGLSAGGEYLPRWVRELPPPHVRAPRGAQIDAAALPDGATVMVNEEAPQRSLLTVRSAVPFMLIFRTYYFPSWYTAVDGRPVAAIPMGSHGLIGVPVAAGEHAIELTARNTAATHVGVAVSALSALTLAVIVGARLVRWRR